MTSAELLGHIKKQPHGRASLKTLFRDLRIRGEQKIAIETALEKLVARGELLEVRSGHYEVPGSSKDLVAGRVSVHRDGFGFLIPDTPVPGMAGDIYLGRDALRGAMQGDRAIVKISFRGREGRAEGEVVRVIRRAHPTVVGEFRITRRGMFVAPFDQRLRDWIEIPEGMEIPVEAPQIDRIGAKVISVKSAVELDGLVVNAEVLDYGEDGGHPAGRVIEVLGSPDDFGIDVEIIIRKHHLPHRFPAEVVEDAERVPEAITLHEIRDRRDFRALPIVTIDGETARDFDDAVLVEKLAEWAFRAAGAYRRCELLREAGDGDRYRGADARHERLFSGPRGADAAVGTFDRYLLAEAAGGPAGVVGADWRSINRAIVVAQDFAAV